jgi:hypothetical protein
MIGYLREKAAHCRRLAENIVGDPTAEALLRLADELESKAAEYPAGERRAEPAKPRKARRRPKTR